MGYFPFFKDIEKKHCLIVGGGEVAYRKAKKLLPYGPILHIIAEDVCTDMLSIVHDIKKRAFKSDDIDGMDFVIAATDDKRLNHEAAVLCRRKNIPVNSVDSKEDCDFIFPSLFKRGELSIGITSGGISPTLSAHYRNIIEENTPSEIEDILDFLNNARLMAKERIADPDKRRIFLKKCTAVCLAENRIMSDTAFDGLLKEYTGEANIPCGFVHIVGAGCSTGDLITVRGLNHVQTADVIIYDDLIDEKLLDASSESCEKIYVGKRGGHEYIKQDEINRIIAQKAKEGKTVVRLKGGDPFIFGRGGEEISALIAKGIPFDETPGITSAIAIPAEAGIPLTYRGLSRSVHIITGHTAQNVPAEDMAVLARLEGTLVFLMGLSNLEDICNSLIKNGKDKSTPAAVISGGNSKNKVTVHSVLSDVSAECKRRDVKSPVVTVIGKAAALELI